MSQLSLAGTTGYVLPPGADPDRDCWCTPSWLTDLLPAADVDPASNPRSTVRSRHSYQLERGQNGLELPWFGLVWCNPPYSNILPWAEKLAYEKQPWAVRAAPPLTGAGFLVNADHSTRWWKRLVQMLPHRLDFDQRIQFKAPPGADASTNNKPQSLLMDDGFLAACSGDLLACGTLWRRA